MAWWDSIAHFVPQTDQEYSDQQLILEEIRREPQEILLRESRVGHISSSGLIINENLNKVLFVHHNIYKTWAWTGGHADGDGDLLAVALREAEEETGVPGIRPLNDEIISMNILPVFGHYKRGNYVSTHLHYNVCYLLVADENLALCVKEDENSGVKWFRFDEIREACGEEDMVLIYQEIISRIPTGRIRYNNFK